MLISEMVISFDPASPIIAAASEASPSLPAGSAAEPELKSSFTSICGPSSPENATKLLKYNQNLVHGAFALIEEGGQDKIVVQANQMAATADPLAISRVLAAVAWQADKVEEKLTGGDKN